MEVQRDCLTEALPIGARVQFNERPSRKKVGGLEAYDVVICE